MAGNRPDTADVHVNALLTNVSVAYKNETYVADKVFPIVYVDKQSNLIAKYTQADFMRDELAVRAPGTEAAEAGWTVDNTTSYFAINYALRKSVPDEIRANADAPYNMDRDTVFFLTEKALINREKKFATAANSTSVWTTSTSVATKWHDYANSDPMSEIFTGNRTVQQLIGLGCNTLVLGQIVFDRLRLHPDFMELVKYTTTNNVPTAAMMGQALGISRVFVVTAIYESAAEGATSSRAAIWDDDALLLYVAPTPSLMVPSAGYTFVWQPGTGGGAQYIRSWRSDSKKTDYFEVQSYYDMKVLTADAGVIWADCTD